MEWHAGELFPRIGFIVTNMSRTPENVVRVCNQRGICEQHIKEGKLALSWTRLSCTRFASNQVRLGLFVLAYNLGNFMRRFALPKEVSHWSLRSIQLKLIKIGAKVVSPLGGSPSSAPRWRFLKPCSPLSLNVSVPLLQCRPD